MGIKRTLVFFMMAEFFWACQGLVSPDFNNMGSKPEFSAVEAEPGITTAVLSAYASNTESISECGFYYGSDSSDRSRIKAELGADGHFIVTVSGLEAQCSYIFSAFAGNGASEVCSEPVTFCTLPVPAPDKPDEPEIPDDPASIINIPDAHFKEYLVWHHDTDGDGEISGLEASAIRRIEIESDIIESLEGIEHFTNLEHLAFQGTRVDESEPCTARLKSIDISHNTQLMELGLGYLPLDTLDISHNPGLQRLEVYKLSIRHLDISHTHNLDIFAAGWCQLETLDISMEDAPREVHLDNNPLTSIHLGSNKNMEYMDCSATRIQSLDISGCRGLNILDCHDNPGLKTLYMAKGQVLGTLTCDEGLKIIRKD